MSKIEQLIKRMDDIDGEKREIKKEISNRITEVRQIISQELGLVSKNIRWSDLKDLGSELIIHVDVGDKYKCFSDSFPRKYLSMNEKDIRTDVKKRFKSS